MKKAEMIKGARVIVEIFGDVKPGEKVLILCDSTTETLAEELAGAVTKLTPTKSPKTVGFRRFLSKIHKKMV